MFKNKKVAENEVCNFYKNCFTGMYKGYQILLAENKKTKKKEYIVTDETNEVIYAHQQIESIISKIDVIMFIKEKDEQ